MPEAGIYDFKFIKERTKEIDKEDNPNLKLGDCTKCIEQKIRCTGECCKDLN